MNLAIASAPWYLLAVAIIGVAVCLALLGIVQVRRYVGVEKLRNNHDVASSTFGIIGLIYGVILGFTIVNVHDRFNHAHQNVENEAKALIDLYRDAAVFPPEVRDNIRNHLREYVEHVIHDEWPKMMNETRIKVIPPKSVTALWHAYYQYTPQDIRQKAWYETSIGNLNEFSDLRHGRIFNTRYSQGAMMWTLLIGGAIITVFFMCFFGSSSLLSQMLMTACLAACIAFMLFLIFTLDAVFTGGARLEPTAFNDVLQSFDNWKD